MDQMPVSDLPHSFPPLTHKQSTDDKLGVKLG